MNKHVAHSNSIYNTHLKVIRMKYLLVESYPFDYFLLFSYMFEIGN